MQSGKSGHENRKLLLFQVTITLNETHREKNRNLERIVRNKKMCPYIFIGGENILVFQIIPFHWKYYLDSLEEYHRCLLLDLDISAAASLKRRKLYFYIKQCISFEKKIFGRVISIERQKSCECLFLEYEFKDRDVFCSELDVC